MRLLREDFSYAMVHDMKSPLSYTVLAAMTIPAIFTATGNLISAIAGLAVAIVLAYQRKSLIVVAVGACAAVFIIEGIITLI